MELVSVVPPIVAAVVAGARLSASKETAGIAYASYGMAGWLLLLTVLKCALARRKDAEAAPDSTHSGLRAATIVLHSAVTHACGITQSEAKDRLRATFHRVVPPLRAPEYIEQIIPYVGWNGTGVGRRFRITTGITGQALRVGEPILMSLDGNITAAQYRDELVRNWGYTAELASSLTPGRCSAMAVPVMDSSGQHPLGVIYLDSDVPHVFDKEETYSAILSACNGIKNFVSERY